MIQIVRDNNGRALIIFRSGPKYLHALALNHPPVRLVKIKLQDRHCLCPLEFLGKPYPLKRALFRFRQAGRAFGITKAAARVLRKLSETNTTQEQTRIDTRSSA